ncbi:MAG: AsmA-like C-terminal region-containing protein [Bacteroidia bacterium]|nr:AsmA-like C-terminal region-containing protein [Bacteroidia bacterium]
MAETVISVSEFSMTMDKEPFTASMVLQNLENYNWDVNATGGVDLEKITKVFPVEGMTLAGIVKADIHTRGQYSDLEAERYDKLPTSGTTSLKNFKYTTADLPAVTISDATMSFDPKKINLQKCDGTIGRSDFAVDGAVFNYLGYALGKNETVQGNVNFRSTLLDLNEFMTDAEAADDTQSEESYGVIPVPDNIDFVLKSTIKTARMMDYTITNATGDIVVKDGIANLNGLHFNMLGGAFTLNGAYNTKDINHPKYDMALKIEKLSIKQAASSFSLVQTYAPIAGLVNGDFSTDFKLSGELKQDMTPNMGTVNAGGLIKIAQAALTESKLVSGITSLTKLDDSNMVTLKDVVMSASIKDGRLSVKPFDVKFGNYKTNIAGSTGLDGSLDYSLKMDVPAGKLGQEFNSFLAQYSGGSKDPNSTVPLVIGLGGSYDSPAPRLVMDEQKAQVKQAVTAAAKEEGTKAVQQAVKGTEAEKVVESLLGGSKKDTTKTDSTKAAAAEDVKKKVEEEAKKKIQNLLKKKNN